MTYDNIANVRFIIRILRFLGLWRSENKHQLYYIIYAGVLHFSLSFPYTIMMWIDVIQAQDLEKFSDNIYMSLTKFAMMAKIINIWVHSQDAWNFFAAVADDDLFALKTKQERKHWSQVTQRYRFVASIYIFVSIAGVSLAFVAVLFQTDYELPFSYAAPFEWRNGQNYWYAYFYGLFAMFVACLSNCALDTLIFYMLLHVSLCYKLIGMRLEKLGYTTVRGLGQSDDEHQFLLEFVKIIVLHEQVKRISKKCETIISYPLMFQIMCSSFVLCFSAYRLQQLRILEEPSHFFYLISVVFVMVLQIFLSCYYGNEIVNNSNALTNAIYESNWYQQSAKIRKLIFIQMEFLKKPDGIRVGNFFDIGLPLFTNILNNAYSLMALLCNLDL